MDSLTGPDAGLKWLRDDSRRIRDLNIVISGMSGRFPKSNSINELEENLRQGNDLINYDDCSRFNQPFDEIPKNYGRINDFDIELGHSLEVVYECILDAGLNPSELRGSKRVGVYSTYRSPDMKESYLSDGYKVDKLGSTLGSFGMNLSQLVAQYFDLRGTVMNIEGQCASSNASITEAIKAIEFGLIDRALVIGTNLPLDPRNILKYSRATVLSAGNCNRPLDARSDGYTKSEAVVSLMLERKSIARRCYATIVQAAISCDGHKTDGITHPSCKSQSDLIATVRSMSKIHRNHVQYIELHAAGTSVGDPIEVESTIGVYNPASDVELKSDEDGDERRSIGPVIIGSAKSCFGHCEWASGLCSIVKVCLMLDNELIYKTVNFEQANPNATSLVEGRAKVATELMKLDGKIIPVNNFGFGGLNAHVVLRANDMAAIEQRVKQVQLQRLRLVVMFGRGKPEVSNFFDKLVQKSNYQTRNCLSDDFLYLLDSINSKPIDRLMNYRGYAIVDLNSKTLIRKHVDKCSMKPSNRPEIHYQSSKRIDCTMFFCGLGSDWYQMISGMKTFAPFWSTIEELHEIMIESQAELDLIGLMTQTDHTKFQSSSKIEMITAYTIAQVNMLRDGLKLHQGVESVKFAGHSTGEIASFYARGIINERQAIMLAHAIGIALENNIEDIGGKMIAIMMSASEIEITLRNFFGGDMSSVRVACINGLMSVTLSGLDSDIDKLCAYLEQSGQLFEVIDNKFAIHNEVTMKVKVKDNLRHILETFVVESRSIKCNPNSSAEWLPCISSLPRHQLNEMTIAEYLAECMCRQVNFMNCYDQIEPDSMVVDFGPVGMFESLVTQHVPNNEKRLRYVKLMSRLVTIDEQVTRTLEGIGKLYTAGAIMDIEKFNSPSRTDKLVRRQTPSLSSLFSWIHNKSFPFPDFNSILSSDRSNRIELNIDELARNMKFLFDHKIEGKCLFPVAGYLFFAWKAFSSMLLPKRYVRINLIDPLEDNLFEPIEFSHIKMHESIIIYGKDHFDSQNRKLIITFKYDPSTYRFAFLYKNNSLICDGYIRSATYKDCDLNRGHMTKSRTQLEFDDSCNMLLHEDIYRGLKVRGYDYRKQFKLIQNSISGRDTTTTSIKFGSHFISFAENLLQAYMSQCLDSCSNDFEQMEISRIDSITILPDAIRMKLKTFYMNIDNFADKNISDNYHEVQNTKSASEANCMNSKVSEDRICLFDVHVNSRVRLVVTDGIEISGITIGRLERNFAEPKLECEMFIANDEQTVDDENVMMKVDKVIRRDKIYLELCNEIAKAIIEGIQIFESQRWIEIKKIIRKQRDDTKQSLLYSLKFIANVHNSKSTNDVFIDISNDIEFDRMILERLCGPILDLIYEECSTTTKNHMISIAEVTQGKNILAPKIIDYIDNNLGAIQSYSYFSSDCEVKLNFKKGLANGVKMYRLEQMDKTNQVFDCIIVKRQYLIEETNDNIFMEILKNKLMPGGFLVVILRQHLSLAERLVMANKRLKCGHENLDNCCLEQISEEMQSIDTHSQHCCERVENESKRLGLFMVAKKTDYLGHVMFVYRNSIQSQAIQNSSTPCIVIRVDHDNVESWLGALQENFKQDERLRKKVWLCAVVTKDRKVNGLIGMIRTLIKEYGSAYLRCYHDEYTFKERSEPVSVNDIKLCDRFKSSMATDLLWNCFDSKGTSGSYRHRRINSYFENDQFNTDAQAIEHHQAARAQNHIGCYADICNRGDLSSFTWHESPFKYLSTEESKYLVSVCYSALNFRDLMIATGAINSALFETGRREDTLLGLEYCGYEMATGKRVMGCLVGGAIATHVLATPDRALQFELPDWIDMKEAATLPVVYLTVILGLIVRGKMRKGESILIHTGSGGVGQAAINLCRYYGLIIYTTAGSRVKRNFLKRQFPDCINDSRIFSSLDCNFEHQIMAATKGRGVDLVLNSLADEKLQASIRCLADGGRFIEIGKYDLAKDSKIELQLLNTNKTYHGISLDKVFSSKAGSTLFRRQNRELVDTFKHLLRLKCIKSSKCTVFNRNQIGEAFKFMAKGKHMSKILIEMNEPSKIELGWEPKLVAVPRMQFSREKSYIVTGGLGGMGMELCKWLSSNGVRYLVVTSRNGFVNQYQKSTLDVLKTSRNCNSLVVTKSTADTETYDGCDKLCKLAAEFAPSRQIGGIFHLSAVLRDGLFDSLAKDDFIDVFKPKLETAIHMDAALGLLHLEPDYFVCFSSISSGKGNVGQTNYSYANCALERLCEMRRSKGLHGVAIQWGLVGDVGLSQNIDPTKQFTGMKLVHQPIASCLNVLSRLVCSPFAITASCNQSVTLETSITRNNSTPTSYLDILGLKDKSQVNQQKTVGEHGLESLMVIELIQHVKRTCGKDMTSQEIRAMKLEDLEKIS